MRFGVSTCPNKVVVTVGGVNFMKSMGMTNLNEDVTMSFHVLKTVM